MDYLPRKIALCLVVLLAGVSAQGQAQTQVPAADEADNCVYARDVKQFEILDNETLLLRGKFDRFWVNRLDGQCAGLRRNMIVQLDRYGTQLCANDRFSAQRRGGPLGGGVAAICRLGSFEEIAIEQASALKQAVSKS